MIYGYLKSRLNDEHVIYDILQETFIAVWKNSRQFLGDSRVSTWIVGIARNKMLDVLRKLYRQDEKWIPLEMEAVVVEEDFSEEVSERISLQTVLQHTTESTRELLHLIFTLGMTYKEAAEVLKIPEGTVKSRMYGIKNELRKKLGREVG
jgi:RNA polymerase sigma-70 factor, ECF subfamily